MDTAEIEKAIRDAPWWAYGVAGGAGLAAVYYFRKHSSGAAGVPAVTAQPEQQPPDGLSAADLAGLPFDYYDWSASVPDPNASQTPGADGGTVTTGDPRSGVIIDPNTGRSEGDAGPPPNQRGGSPSGSPGGQPSNPGPQVYHHTVEAWPAWDSTLSGIAGHYGMSWGQLYNYGNDKSIIDNAAHAHGHYSQEYNWLFPGEVLEVPSAN